MFTWALFLQVPQTDAQRRRRRSSAQIPTGAIMDKKARDQLLGFLFRDDPQLLKVSSEIFLEQAKKTRVLVSGQSSECSDYLLRSIMQCSFKKRGRHIKYKVIDFARSNVEIMTNCLFQPIWTDFLEGLNHRSRDNSAKYIAR